MKTTNAFLKTSGMNWLGTHRRKPMFSLDNHSNNLFTARPSVFTYPLPVNYLKKFHTEILHKSEKFPTLYSFLKSLCDNAPLWKFPSIIISVSISFWIFKVVLTAAATGIIKTHFKNNESVSVSVSRRNPLHWDVGRSCTSNTQFDRSTEWPCLLQRCYFAGYVSRTHCNKPVHIVF